jgi:starvation-inducible DNA-binding protein
MTTIETIQQGEAHPTLSHHEQIEIGRELQATLAELINLALLGKHLHWSVVGAGFRSIHLELDEFVASWSTLADLVAERSVAVGYSPDGQAKTIAESGELSEVTTGPLPDREVIQILTHRLIEAVANCRVRIATIGNYDLASQDVLIKVALALEEQLWMVRAQRDR